MYLSFRSLALSNHRLQDLLRRHDLAKLGLDVKMIGLMRIYRSPHVSPTTNGPKPYCIVSLVVARTQLLVEYPQIAIVSTFMPI